MIKLILVLASVVLIGWFLLEIMCMVFFNVLLVFYMSLRICFFVFKSAFVEELQYSQKKQWSFSPHGTIIFFWKVALYFCIKKAEKSCAIYNFSFLVYIIIYWGKVYILVLINMYVYIEKICMIVWKLSYNLFFCVY